jgi:hypothetical protein
MMSGRKKKLSIEFGANHRADGAATITMDTTAGSAVANEEMLLIGIASTYDAHSNDLGIFTIDGVTPSPLYSAVDNSDGEHVGLFVGVKSITDGDYTQTLYSDPRNLEPDQYIADDFRLSYCRVLGKSGMYVVNQGQFIGTNYPYNASPIEAQKGDIIVAIMNVRHGSNVDTLNVSSSTHNVELLFADTMETYPRFKIFTIDVDDNATPSLTFNVTDAYQQGVAMYLIIRGA